MRLKLFLNDNILGSPHKLWIDIQDLSKISELITHLSDSFEVPSSIDLYLDDFYLHPDLSLSVLHDSNLVSVKFSEPQKPEEKPSYSKSFRRQMKRNPKMVEFTGKRIKFNSQGEVSSVSQITNSKTRQIKSEKFEKLLPHQLSQGDFINFQLADDPASKVMFNQQGKVKKVTERSVKIELKNGSIVSLDKGSFGDIKKVFY